MKLQWKLQESKEKLVTLLPAVMVTVDIGVKMVESHQPGVLSDNENQLVHGTG